MNKENNNVVYIHTNVKNNEVFYVGQGSPSRPYSKLRSNEWKDYTKENEYETKVVSESLSLSEAYEIEEELIGLFGRLDLGEGTLLNKTDGGAGAKRLVVSKENRDRISIQNSGRGNGMYGVSISGKDHGHYGKPHTQERKDKSSLTRRRKWITDENYLLLVDDIKRRANKSLKITRGELMEKYSITLDVLNLHIKKVKNNNIII